ncbi:receptor activity-modifying protein 1-like isoform X2 [Erpetoichthys calabaricus]|uniref:Receptor activity-modifying protein 1-like n=1 Tax=Erpetoichthys calabaricus TaxID=27687 RepID=A0A8C4SIB9_ERPCA|nr:receptor activity-modifying protein 1-like isoform X2 [Erpetoichthys calabaricus]
MPRRFPERAGSRQLANETCFIIWLFLTIIHCLQSPCLELHPLCAMNRPTCLLFLLIPYELHDYIDIGEFVCNETMLGEYILFCWVPFQVVMSMINTSSCNWNEAIRPYAELVMCTKEVSWDSGCDYPNLLTEEFFLQIHTEYFSNCSTQAVNLEPPETVVMFLTITCVSMVIFLSAFITWRNSRRNLTSKDTMVYFELKRWTESHSVK